MFPKLVSEGLFSFQEDKVCPAISLWMKLADDGTLAECGVVCSNVKPMRSTYDAVCQMLEADQPEHSDLSRLSKVSPTAL